MSELWFRVRKPQVQQKGQAKHETNSKCHSKVCVDCHGGIKDAVPEAIPAHAGDAALLYSFSVS